MILEKQDIKIEKGKITTFVSERCSGMSTLLCEYATDFLKNNDGNVLIISHSTQSAKHTYEKLLNVFDDKTRVKYSSIDNASSKLHGQHYGMIIYDCPDIMNENKLWHLAYLMSLGSPKIIIGITWENIAFTKDVNKLIRKNFTNNSNYAYFMTVTYTGKQLFYEIENSDTEELKEEFYGYY